MPSSASYEKKKIQLSRRHYLKVQLIINIAGEHSWNSSLEKIHWTLFCGWRTAEFYWRDNLFEARKDAINNFKHIINMLEYT